MLRSLVLIVIAAPAWACSCGGYPSAKEAWIETPLMFAGIVEKVEPKSLERSMTGEQSAFVRVTETFKGAKKDQVIELRDRLSSCFLGFQEGAVELFYVYPGEKQGTWIAPPCHRTRRMDDAADDLQFLRGLPDSARGNRVSGVIHLYDNGRCTGALTGITLAMCDYMTSMPAGSDCTEHRRLERHFESALKSVVRRLMLEGLRRAPA